MSSGGINSLETLVDLVTNPPADLLRPEAREIAVMALTDLTGVTLAGVTEEVAAIVAALVGGSASSGASIVGSGAIVSEADAALVNATIGHALDFDDSSFVLGGHPSVVIYPALLAVAEARGKSPANVISAYLVGLEALSRISRAVNFAHYEKGWHPTATLGIFGAAAGAAHLLRLDPARTAHALGIAKSRLTLVRGATSRYKTFRVD